MGRYESTRNEMKIIIQETERDATTYCAQRILATLKRNPSAVLGLATGDTPKATYDLLVNAYAMHQVSFEHVTTFNLDEYVGMDGDNVQSYQSYMHKHLFDHVNIRTDQTFFPECRASVDFQKAAEDYELSIATAGGIDLQLLGIGRNGHIGFNEPTSSLASRTRIKTLSHGTLKANARLFKKGEEQPSLAMTMGIGTILEAREVVLVATGAQKSEAVCNTVEGPLTAMCPASALQLHNNATIVMDKLAASRLTRKGYYAWVREHAEALIATGGSIFL